MPLLASDCMARAASLLNDTAQSLFTNVALLPYLQTAYDELAEELENNNVPMTNEKSSIFVITTTMFDIGGTTGPALPTDLIEIQGLFERLSGSAEDFQEMTRVEFLPPFVQVVQSLIYWTWQVQIIQFLGASTTRDVRMNYIGNTLSPITAANSPINLINAKNFLSFRTAMLASEYIGENPERAQELGTDTTMALDRLINMSTKGRQAIITRRRPFLSRYKITGGW